MLEESDGGWMEEPPGDGIQGDGSVLIYGLPSRADSFMSPLMALDEVTAYAEPVYL